MSCRVSAASAKAWGCRCATGGASCGSRTSPRRRTHGVDVTDPRAPRVVVQTELPHAKVRSSNSLIHVGDTHDRRLSDHKEVGMKPAGFDVFDIGKARDAAARFRTFDASGPHFRAACTPYGSSTASSVHMAGGGVLRISRRPIPATTSLPHHRRQPLQAGRSRPLVVPRHASGDSAPPQRREPVSDTDSAHNTNVLQRPTAPMSATSTAAR